MDDLMKIDPGLVRKHRETKAWSQDHLAQISGVSLRTIQRVEAEGMASIETRMAIASAFGLAPDALTTTSVAVKKMPWGARAGLTFGTAAAIFGATCACLGIYHGPNAPYMDGVLYGIIGLELGVSLAIIGVLSNYYARGRGARAHMI